MISDVHGEDQKLRHVINNASGPSARWSSGCWGTSCGADDLTDFLALCFYPAEVVDRLGRTLAKPADVREFAKRTLRLQFVLVRELVARYSRKRAMRDFPDAWRPLLEEMLHEQVSGGRREAFFGTVVDELVHRGQALHVVHLVGRLIRNLAIDELIIAGDCWDRGPRGDRVVDYLRQQPSVSFVWGNHDVSWIGAALGNEALICTVLRISLRYRRLGQLDEGYSIPLTPLEHLARTCYGDDPAASLRAQIGGHAGHDAGRPDAEGGRGHAVQARGAGDRPQPRLGAGPPPAAAPDRRRGRHGRDRRPDVPAPRPAPADGRPGRPVRAQRRGAAVHGPHAALVPGQPKAVASTSGTWWPTGRCRWCGTST